MGVDCVGVNDACSIFHLGLTTKQRRFIDGPWIKFNGDPLHLKFHIFLRGVVYSVLFGVY